MTRTKLLASLLIGAAMVGARQADGLCPSRKFDDPAEIIQSSPRPRPAPLTTFLDAAYLTCFERITDDPGSSDAPVPIRAGLQAWNVDQTKLLLASGDILASPSWTPGVWQLGEAIRKGAPRWSPSDPEILYYLDGNRLESWNVSTLSVHTIRQFDEYAQLDPSGSHDDAAPNGLIALVGRTAQGTAEAFVYDLVRDRKGTTLGGTRADGSVLESVGMTPLGDFVWLRWRNPSGGLWIQSCDTAMVDEGRLAPFQGAFDVALDSDGTQWVVGSTSGAIGGIQGGFIAKYRVPNGWDRIDSGDPSGAGTLCPWEDRPDAASISASAPGVGYVIVSHNVDATHASTLRLPFSNELVKLYLDSSLESPHLERLADTRTDPYAAASSCAFRPQLAGQAFPNGTLSRDGTRVLWGSTWGASCRSEAYVMDISNKSRNPAFADLPLNTWVQLHPASYRFDGTREVADRFPIMQFGRAVFAPEYGSIISWGGGGHGASRMGNDVWLYDTARNEWRQVTPGDPIESYPNPGLAAPLLGDYCHNDSSFTFFWSTCDPTSNLPIGSTASGAPWSSHNYSQRAWDSYNRRFVIYGPNYITGLMADSYGYFAARASYAFDPHLRTWTFLGNNPHLYHQGGAMAFDPVNRRMVAMNHDWWHHAGYNSSANLFNFRWWLDVTTDTWAEKPADLVPNMFDSDLVYDPLTRKMYRYGGDFPTDSDLWCYDSEEDTWTLRSPIPDPAYGVPPAAAPSAAVGRDGTMLLWGFGGEGECLPTWTYDTRLNTWQKMNAVNDPISEAPVTDRIHDWTSLVYDPTNNVFFLLKIDPHQSSNDIGGWPKSLIGEMWVYKHDNEPIEATAASETQSQRPHLAQNAPNPFSTRTGIAFTLEAPARVTLTIFDVQGRVVARLADRPMAPGPGQVTWDGRDTLGHAAAAGVYWYELKAGPYRSSRKLVLVR